ncbi:MAG: carbohydrate-binding module family 14 protein [Rikenellaceae bacterium]|nr:carbohydrate-binding module family 14 protein [Rikenellaceae bacterium]MCL2691940.1 carbohydrate-binding module family 14 protein [Rikenellaceae bacterium]
MIKTLISKLTPKTTLNKVNLALTGLFCVMLVGNIYMRAKMYGIFYPDPENCGAFFKYEGEVLVRDCCPVGLVFCEELQYCVFPGDPNCTFDCVTAGSCEPGQVDDDKVKKKLISNGRECFIVIQEGDGWKFIPGHLFECVLDPGGQIYCVHSCFEKYQV